MAAPDRPNDLFCPHCQYSLDGVRAKGRGPDCPECGKRFTLDSGEIQLPFWPLAAATVGVPVAFGGGSAVARSLHHDGEGELLLRLMMVSAAAAPFVFAWVASRRWRRPLRSKVFARYLVAGLMLGGLGLGILLLGTFVLETLLRTP